MLIFAFAAERRKRFADSPEQFNEVLLALVSSGDIEVGALDNEGGVGQDVELTPASEY